MRGTAPEVREAGRQTLGGHLAERVLRGNRRGATELAAMLLHRVAPIAQHVRLLVVHRGHRSIVHLFHVALLSEALNVEVERVVDLLVEEHAAGFTTARPWRSGAETRDKAVGYEVSVVQTAVIERLKAALCKLLLSKLLLLLLLQKLKLKSRLRELTAACLHVSRVWDLR